MADFTLPRPRRRQSEIPPTSLPVLPVGRMQSSQPGVDGFLTRLPASIGSGTPTYQAGIDQSREGQAAQAAGGMADQMVELRREQDAALAKHKQYREGLKAAQQQVDTRNNDLRLAQNLLIATDPNVDKAVRKFMLSGLSQAAGVDPKGEYSQNLQKMVLGMTPEALEALRGSFGDDITNSPPGAIQQQLNSLFSGDTPIENVIGQVKKHQETKAAAAAALTAPGLPLTSGASASGAAPIPEGAVAEGAAELAGGAGTAPAVTPPSPQQRQAVIAAAGMTDPSVAAAGEAAGTPAVTPPPAPVEPPPEVPIPPSTPIDVGEGPATTTPPPQPEAPTAPAAPTVDPSIAAAGEAAGAGATATTTPPTAATPPPEPTSRMEIPESLRKAAEETGDKLLLDAIAKIDQRNAVLDSDASHRRAAGTAAAPGGKASAADPSVAAAGAAAGTPGAPAGEGAPAPSPQAAELGKILDVDPEKAGLLDSFMERPAVKAITDYILGPDVVQAAKDISGYKSPEERKAKDAEVEAANTETRKKASEAREAAAAAAPSPGERAQMTLRQANEFNRRNTEPADPSLRFVEKKDRPDEQQDLPAIYKTALAPWLDRNTKYTVGDTQSFAPGITIDKETEKEVRKAVVHRDTNKTELYDAANNIFELLALKGGEKLTGGVTLSPGWTITGVLGLGGVETNPAAQAARNARIKASGGFTDEQYDNGIKYYKEKIQDQLMGHYPGMSNERKLEVGTALASELMRLEAQVAIQQNPGRAPTDADREAARRMVGNMNFSPEEMYSSIRKVVQNTDTRLSAEVGSQLGRPELGSSMAVLPREARDRFLELHPKLAEQGRPLLTPQQIRDMQEQNRKEDDAAKGVPPRDNDYLVTKGGVRPEHYDKAHQAELTVKEARDVRAQGIQEERLTLAKEQFKHELEKYDAAQKRQSMLDARHAQEKMAAAFQHIGAMIAGSVKGISGGGGSGISAGGEDTSVFRIAPPPQRQAPRVGGVQPPTRYGGPIKRMQQ